MRNVELVEKEFYHIYNRSVEKRPIFLDKNDYNRFLKSFEIFNTAEIVGNLERGGGSKVKERIVKIVAYCINPNHFHLILEQVGEKGIEKFMHKISMGYAKYFNLKYKRSGALFQGRFKAKLVDTNEYLLHLSAYVNLNHLAHARRHPVSTEGKTSWPEYVDREPSESICDTGIILDQFKSRAAYRKFAESSLNNIKRRKILLDELEEAGIELIKS